MKLAGDFKQNTKAWYSWRRGGLGASDAPVVMGVSPYSTRFELWAQKTGLMERPEPNAFQAAAMRRGHDLEPVARMLYENLVNDSFPAVSCQHENFDYIRASLDGYSENSDKLIEIKCPGKVDHKAAQNGIIPEKYVIQIQTQFAVSGASSGDYISYDGKERENYKKALEKGGLVIISIEPDREMQADIIRSMQLFWELVQTKVAPNVDAMDLTRVTEALSKHMDKINQAVEGLQVLNNAFANQLVIGGK